MKRLLPLLLVAAGAAAPASAQVVDRVIGYATPGQLYTNYSYGTFNKVYDGDGKEQQVGGGGTGSNVTVQRLGVGGSYNVAQAGALGVYVGAEFAMASRTTELNFPAPVGTVKGESGFKPQSVGLGVGVRGPAYGFGVAYQHDLGPDFKANSLTSFDDVNSDNAHALVLGGEVYTPFAGFTMTAGGNYYITLKGDQERSLGGTTVKRSVDPADYLDLHVGAAYRVADMLEVGLQARYLRRFEGEVFGTTAVANEDEGYAIGVIPYLTLSPQSVPVQLTVSASTTQEYTPYGFTLGGNNLPVGRTGVTVGLRYGF